MSSSAIPDSISLASTWSQPAPAPTPTADSGSTPPPEQVTAYSEGSSNAGLIPFIATLTENNTEYMKITEDVFKSLRVGSGGTNLDIADELDQAVYHEVSKEVSQEAPLAQLSGPSRIIDSRARILFDPSANDTGTEETGDSLQIVLEEKLLRMPNETPEHFNIRVQTEEMRAGMYAQKLAVIKKTDPNREKLTEQEKDVIELKLTEKDALLRTKMARELQIAPGTKSSYNRHQSHWRGWCERKGYRRTNLNKVEDEEVDDRVEYARYVLYLTEGLAEHSTDGGDDPRKA
ncbi:hypothetical protein BGX30_004335, partial [Mortierella sp. GBA39]